MAKKKKKKKRNICLAALKYFVPWCWSSCHGKQACLDGEHETGTCLANSTGWEGPVSATGGWVLTLQTSRPQIWSSWLGLCIHLLPFSSLILDRGWRVDESLFPNQEVATVVWIPRDIGTGGETKQGKARRQHLVHDPVEVWVSPASLGNLCQCLATFKVKTLPLWIMGISHLPSFVHCLSSFPWPLRKVWLCPLKQLKKAAGSPINFLFLSLNKPTSFSLFEPSYICSILMVPLPDHLGSLCWTPAHKRLHGSGKPKPGRGTPDAVSQVLNEEQVHSPTSCSKQGQYLHQPAAELLLIQPRMQLAAFTVRACCWFMLISPILRYLQYRSLSEIDTKGCLWK